MTEKKSKFLAPDSAAIASADKLLRAADMLCFSIDIPPTDVERWSSVKRAVLDAVACSLALQSPRLFEDKAEALRMAILMGNRKVRLVPGTGRGTPNVSRWEIL